MLIDGADAGIKRGALHARRPFCPLYYSAFGDYRVFNESTGL
jgi:hypothetical protein